MPITHEVTIDQVDNCGDTAFAAFCTDECGWRGEWHHSDAQPGFDFDSAEQDAAIDEALRACEAEAAWHLDTLEN